MRSHARRFWCDLRQVRAWLAAVAATAFLIGLVLPLALSSAVEQARSGVLSPLPPQQPLSFLGAIDPHASVDVVVGETEPAMQSPGIVVLLEQLPRLRPAFLSLPLSVFAETVVRRGDDYSPGAFYSSDHPGTVVLGAAPPFLDSVPESDGSLLLWGSIAGKTSGIDDSHLGPVPVRQRGPVPPGVTFVDGSGRLAHAADQPLLVASPSVLSRLTVELTTRPVNIVAGLTCYCDVQELQPLASAMTEAERMAGTNRLYYVHSYDALLGPIERSYAVSSVVTSALTVVGLVAVACLVLVAARLMLARRVAAHRAEVLCGAGAASVHLRQQLLVALALTIPTIVGFSIMDVVRQSDAATPSPWPQGGGWLLILLAVSLQVVGGTGTAIQVQRLVRNPLQEQRHV